MAGDPIDIHVGSRLRQRRKLRGLSQTKLATLLGITFQQVQKYENGSNGLSSSRMHAAATILDVNVDYFFEGLPGDNQPAYEGKGWETLTREMLSLNRAFPNIKDTKVRAKLLILIETLSGHKP